MQNFVRSRGGGFLRRWAGDAAGNYTIIFALSLVPILIAIGSAVDLSQAYVVKQRMTRALDAAGLAVGGVSGLTTAQMQTMAQNYFNANYPASKIGVPGTVSVTQSGQTVSLTASATMPTSVMGIVGVNSMTVGASSQITKMGSNIEVALAVDLSGSMAGQKIADLKTAAASLIDIVVQSTQTPYYSKMAIVPYSMGVNVGTYAAQVRGSAGSGTCTTPGCQNYKFKNPSNQWNTFAISNCVSERTGTNAYTDVAPSTAPVGLNYPASGNPCLTNTITPLSSNVTTLKSDITALAAGGSTAGQVGIAWAWYLVSPNFSYLWPSASQPAAYGTQHLIKAVIIMTDGEYNSSYCNGVIAQDSTSGSGSTSDHINCDSTNGGSYDQSMTLCAAMKNAGVIVYTVGFMIDMSSNAPTLLSSCATDASHVYFPSSGASLQTAFSAIGQSISNLRISQ